MPLRTLVIKSSEWLRKRKRDSKNYAYKAFLHDKDKKMCCLGIMARECEINEADICYTGTLASISSEKRNSCVNKWLTSGSGNNDNALRAMKINDMLLDDDDKIERLRPIFKAQGWKLDWRPNE